MIYQEETDSTNDALRRLYATESLPEGALVHAGFQQSGRGQEANTWESERGENLLMSILLKPSYLQANEQVWLNFAVSVALQAAVAELGIVGIKIKWPNDLYVNGKKLSGILIENVLQGSRLKYSIVGIGLNVNQTTFANTNAISLFNVANHRFDIKEVREMICGQLTRTMHLLRGKRRQELMEAYHAHLLGKGESSLFSANGRTFEAEVMGVDLKGRLHLLADGEVLSFANKEVQYLGAR